MICGRAGAGGGWPGGVKIPEFMDFFQPDQISFTTTDIFRENFMSNTINSDIQNFSKPFDHLKFNSVIGQWQQIENIKIEF